MKVIVFTADENNGGIKQFTIKVFESCLNNGYDSTLFIPNIKSIEIPDQISDKTIRYKKQKDILGITPAIIKTAKQINEIKPDVVYLTDDAMYSIQVMKRIKKGIRVIMTMHDITQHPGKMSIKRRFLTFISTTFYRKIAFKRFDNIITLSDNSRDRLVKQYPKIENKILTFKLGAHPPLSASPHKPIELNNMSETKFLLVFGRIQKYKGIFRTINAFNSLTDNKEYSLVVAGNGSLTEEEKNGALINSKIYLINRFINDDEMVWLFQNSTYVVLSYIEASQSGVIPMAYHFGKPVVASNIDGLKEFVEESKTGYLFDNDDNFKDILHFIVTDSCACYQQLCNNCLRYENDFLNWNKNMKTIIEKDAVNN